MNEVGIQGDFNNRYLYGEPTFRKEYGDTGFWCDSYGWLMISNLENQPWGQVGFKLIQPQIISLHYFYIRKSFGEKGLQQRL